jgi:hypothetical protein
MSYQRPHIISDEELNDFSFEHLIAASSGGRSAHFRKQLLAFVQPSRAHLHFKVMKDDECVLACGVLSEAIRAYNDLG